MPLIKPKTLECTEALKELFDGLLGVETKLEPGGEPLEPSPGRHLVATRYLNREDVAKAVAVADESFVYFMGAGLAMMPAEKAEESLASHEPPEELLDNGREVLNVAAAVINDAQSMHVRIDELYRLPGVLPSDVTDVICRPRIVGNWAVEIPGYGTGRLTIYVG